MNDFEALLILTLCVYIVHCLIPLINYIIDIIAKIVLWTLNLLIVSIKFISKICIKFFIVFYSFLLLLFWLTKSINYIRKLDLDLDICSITKLCIQ